jgi:hypothetical protein
MKAPLTLAGFLDEVYLLRDKGYIAREEADGIIVIRSPSGPDHCVVTAVAEMRTGAWFGMSQVSRAGRHLGLSPILCERIVDANDFPEYAVWYRDRLRQQLFEALGLASPIAARDGGLP